MDLIYNEHVSFRGRNGTFKQDGIAILTDEQIIRLRPITSKMVIGNCYLELPRKDLGEFIRALIRIEQGEKL